MAVEALLQLCVLEILAHATTQGTQSQTHRAVAAECGGRQCGAGPVESLTPGCERRLRTAVGCGRGTSAACSRVASCSSTTGTEPCVCSRAPGRCGRSVANTTQRQPPSAHPTMVGLSEHPRRQHGRRRTPCTIWRDRRYSAGTDRRGTRSLPSTTDVHQSSASAANTGDISAPGGEKAQHMACGYLRCKPSTGGVRMRRERKGTDRCVAMAHAPVAACTEVLRRRLRASVRSLLTAARPVTVQAAVSAGLGIYW